MGQPDFQSTVFDYIIRPTKIQKYRISVEVYFHFLCSLSRDISGRVKFENSSAYILKNPEKVFHPGKVVTVKVMRYV